MYNHRIAWVGFIFNALLLQGCATSARVEQMVATPDIAPDEIPVTAALVEGVSVGLVTGGSVKKTSWISRIGNEELKQALEDSLQNAKLFHPEGQYELKVTLLSATQPVGFKVTVKTRIHYVLTDRSTNKLVYSKVITDSYTSSFADAFKGKKQLKPNEGAARENIAEFIENLYRLKLIK